MVTDEKIASDGANLTEELASELDIAIAKNLTRLKQLEGESSEPQ